MAGITHRKACLACAKAKRRCGKQTPSCLRCVHRKIGCSYPPPKPSRFIPVEDFDSSSNDDQSSQLSSTSAPTFTNLEVYPIHVLFPEDCLFTADTESPTGWFASSKTWKTKHPDLPDRTPFNIRSLKRHISTVKQWLTDWIKNGSNHFIHPQLYSTRFPSCIRDAYADYACYINRTASNEDTVFQIIEKRVENLLATTYSSTRLDPLVKLARVHALFIYQVIGLFDGDIRLRYLSEKRIPLLHEWMHEMVDDARQASCLGKYVCDMEMDSSPGGTANLDLLWYSWILAESIRRTWVIASGIQGIFVMMQLGKVAQCQGGMMLTTRKGVWEAQSALAWETICAEVNVGLIQTAELYQAVLGVGTEHLNDFAKAVIQVTSGKDIEDT